MNAKFSPSSMGIYPVAAFSTFPDDAIDIPGELYSKFLDGEVSRLTVVDGQVVAYSPSVDDQRSAKWEAIKAERDRRKAGGVMVGDKWFHSDQSSRLQQLGNARRADRVEAAGGDLDAPLLAPDESVLEWKTLDGSFVTMTARLAQQIVGAYEMFDIELFSIAEAHRAALNASQNPADYDYSTGWPQAFHD